MTLAEVVELRQRHLGRELPGFSPYRCVPSTGLCC